jgi:hypothetical protein
MNPDPVELQTFIPGFVRGLVEHTDPIQRSASGFVRRLQLLFEHFDGSDKGSPQSASAHTPFDIFPNIGLRFTPADGPGIVEGHEDISKLNFPRVVLPTCRMNSYYVCIAESTTR